MDGENHTEIIKDYQNRVDELLLSIDRIGIRQSELQGYIVTIDHSINSLDIQAKTSQVPDQKIKCYNLIQKNTELLVKLFDSISGFEGIRQRYQQDINKLTTDKIRLLNIELKRIEDKTNSTVLDASVLVNELRDLIRNVANTEVNKDIKSELNKDAIYNMD